MGSAAQYGMGAGDAAAYRDGLSVTAGPAPKANR
jgi:hypothetical protein